MPPQIYLLFRAAWREDSMPVYVKKKKIFFLGQACDLGILGEFSSKRHYRSSSLFESMTR